MFLELYRTSANVNEVVRRQNSWLERVKSKGGIGTLHLMGKKKNRDWMVDGDDEDGEEEFDDAEERGGLEEEDRRRRRSCCSGGGNEFEYNS